MTVQKIFQSVNIRKPCEEWQFVDAYNSTVLELIAAYRKKYVVGDEYIESYTIDNIDGNITIFEDYIPALIDNILFELGSDTKGEFVRKAENAYIARWKALNNKVYIRSGV